jgi:hypothetical protein
MRRRNRETYKLHARSQAPAWERGPWKLQLPESRHGKLELAEPGSQPGGREPAKSKQTPGKPSKMAYTFKLTRESLKREFAVYVVIARGSEDIHLYVGKTGDNREGCNPIISRCGNHFSYNRIHSQVRNKLEDHEERDYTYIFDHFGAYVGNEEERKELVAQINELERWLNESIQEIIKDNKKCTLINPFNGIGYVSRLERERRASYRTGGNAEKIQAIVRTVASEIKN